MNNRKRIISVTALALVIFSLVLLSARMISEIQEVRRSRGAGGLATFFFSPDSISVKPGETFTLTLYLNPTLEGLEQYRVSAFDTSITYPADMLSLASAEYGDIFQKQLKGDPGAISLKKLEINNPAGTVKIAMGTLCTTAAPWQCFTAQNTGVAATLRFTALPSSGRKTGTITLNPKDVAIAALGSDSNVVNFDKIPFVSIAIQSPSPSLSPTASPTAKPSPTATPTPITATPTPRATPTPTPRVTSTPTPTPTPSTSSRLSEIQKQITETEAKLADLQSQEKTLSSQIAVVDNQIALTTLRIDAVRQQISDLTLDIDTTIKKIGSLEESIDELTKVLINRIIATYEVGGTQSFEVLMEWGDVFTYGEKKYARDNWLKGTDWHEFYGSALRHLYRFWAGEDVDPETGINHLAHALWNVAAIRAYQMRGLGQDDRHKTKEEAK
ncbi:MAG: hypothetical protein UW73_C0014G0002 [Microgenomates group bacterium GW2011_GWB1_44_8]|nr:MAG: hypothetical protein UW73_C0014G0002 [Microgenomates group bacterium GW2011_GWB1_44_8]